MQVNGEVVYLNLKFVPEGHVEKSTPAPGFRKKSPSEKSRDYQRLCSYKDKNINIEQKHTHWLNNTDGDLFAVDLDSDSIIAIGNHQHQSQPCVTSEKSEVDPETTGSSTCNIMCNDGQGLHNQVHDMESNKSDTENVTDLINETFNKVVHDGKSKLLGAITYDNRVALFGYTKFPYQTWSDRFEIFTCSHQKYSINIEAIRDKDNIMEDQTMQEHMYQMCKSLKEYDDNLNNG